MVRKTISQMSEELVNDQVIAQPHTTLLRQMGRNVGLSEAQMDAVSPVPLVKVSFNVWENIAHTRHWAAGWLATSVDEFIITNLPEHNFQAAVWKQTFGLNDDQVFFLTYHGHADDDHAGRKVWQPIERNVTRQEERLEVLDAVGLSLSALKLFYQGICELGDQLDRV